MRKLNVRWLAGVVVSPIILVGIAYLIHELQMSRNASVFIREAKRAQSENRPGDAILHFRRYVKLAPNDAEGLILYGNQLADLKSVQGAFLTLEKALRLLPDRSDVRRRLVDLAIKLERYQDARDHLEKRLLKESPRDSELLELLAKCQFEQSDIEGAVASLVASTESSSDRVDAYLSLAQLRRDSLNDLQKADETIDDMVAKNPDNHLSHLYRGRWRMRNYDQLKLKIPAATDEELANLKELISTDIEKCLELAPDDTEALLFAINVTQYFEDRDKARTLISRGIEAHPDDPKFYEALADLEFRSRNNAGVTEALQRGIAAVPDNAQLKWSLASWYIDSGENDKAQELIKQLAALKYPAPKLGYLEGRILANRQEWSAAIAKFESVRLDLRELPAIARQNEYWLGVAYREINSQDQALMAFRRAVILDSNWILARIALAESLSASKLYNDAISEFRQLSIRPEAPLGVILGLERAILQLNLSRAPDQRNWVEFDQVARNFDAKLTKLEELDLNPDQAAKLKSQRSQAEVLKAERLLSEEKKDDAEKSIASALEKNPGQIELWTARIGLAQKNRDWDRAESLIRDAEKQFGDSDATKVPLRALRGRLIVQRETAEKARELLRPLAEAPADWTEQQRLQLATDFSLLYFMIEAYDEAEKMATIVENALPNNLPIRLLLLDIGTRSTNLELMERMLDEIRVATGEGPIWQYGQARRLTLLGDRTKDKQNYIDAKEHLEKASIDRPNWDRLHTLWGEILERQGNPRAAVDQYLEAIREGERSTKVTSRTLAMLLNARRNEDADKMLDLLEESQSPFTNEMYQARVELDIQFDRKERALKSLEKLVKQPQRNLDPMWFGRIYYLLEKYDESETQIRKAIDANKKDPVRWTSLVQAIVRTKHPEKADAVIEEAKSELEGGLGALAIAQCYELKGQLDLAREWYSKARNEAPENQDIQRQQIEFWLRIKSPAEAQEALEDILSKTDETSETDQATRQWAQQRLLDSLRLQGGPEKLQQALNLIKEKKTETVEDLRNMAQILAAFTTRPERQLAIEILEKLVVKETSVPLQIEERILLAGLYSSLNDSERSRAELRTILATRKNDARALMAYVQLSLQAKEYSEVELYLASLKKLNPDDLATSDLEIQLSFARKRYAEIDSLLKSIVNRPIEKNNPEAFSQLLGWAARRYSVIGSRLAQRNEKEQSDRFNLEADALYEKLIERMPDEVLNFAEHLVGTAAIDRGLKLTQDHFSKLTFPRLQQIIRTAMKNTSATAEQLAECQKLLDAWENDQSNPKTPAATFLAADLLSWRGEYEASAARYREVLSREKKSVVALNNLAFLLALSGGDHVEALRLITEAMAIGTGPMDALLDTRGFVYLAGGNFPAAASDFEKSAAEKDNGERSFHAAIAYARMKKLKDAVSSLTRADELGLAIGELHPVERATLKKLRADLNLPETPR